MFKYVLLAFGAIGTIVAMVIPVIWPFRPNKNSPTKIVIFVIAVAMSVIFGAVSVKDIYDLDQNNDILSNQNAKLSKQLDFYSQFISFISPQCFDQTQRNFSKGQANLKSIENLHSEIGSPDSIFIGNINGEKIK